MNRGDAAADAQLDGGMSNGRDDGGESPDEPSARDADTQRDGTSGESGGGDSGEPSSGQVTITRTLPELDRVYVKDTVQIQFLVDGADGDVEVDLIVGDETVARLRPPYRYELDTRALAEGETTLSGTLHGQSSIASEPLVVVVDRSPPLVVARAPTPNAQSVWYLEPMGLSFSEPIVPETVTSSSVRLSTAGEGSLAASLSVASDARSVAIAMEVLPALPAVVSVSATEAITDLAGNALTPDTWSFEMPEWVDSPGAPDGDDDPIAMALAVTDAGEQFVAWVDDDNVVRVARRTWGAWEALPGWTDNDSANHDVVGIALDGQEQPIVAYLRDTTIDVNGGQARALRWDGNAWQDLGSPPGTDEYYGPLFMRRDPAGGAPYLMVGGTQGGNTWRIDDSSWTPLPAGGGDSYYPVQSLAIMPDGGLLIGRRTDSGCSVTRVAGSGTDLGSPPTVGETCIEMHVAAHPDGTPWAVMARSNQDTLRYRYASDPSYQQPTWMIVPIVFSNSDPDDVAFSEDGRLLMMSRGSPSISGMVLTDWTEGAGQPLGNWPDSAEARFTFYAGGASAVLRLRDVTQASPQRRFDIVVSLQNRMPP